MARSRQQRHQGTSERQIVFVPLGLVADGATERAGRSGRERHRGSNNRSTFGNCRQEA